MLPEDRRRYATPGCVRGYIGRSHDHTIPPTVRGPHAAQGARVAQRVAMMGFAGYNEVTIKLRFRADLGLDLGSDLGSD